MAKRRDEVAQHLPLVLHAGFLRYIERPRIVLSVDLWQTSTSYNTCNILCSLNEEGVEVILNSLAIEHHRLTIRQNADGAAGEIVLLASEAHRAVFFPVGVGQEGNAYIALRYLIQSGLQLHKLVSSSKVIS